MSINWQEVIRSARQHGHDVISELHQQGNTREQAIALLSEQLGMPVLADEILDCSTIRLDHISIQHILEWGVLPLTLPNQQSIIAIADPFDAQIEARLPSLFANGSLRYLIDREKITRAAQNSRHSDNTPDQGKEPATPVQSGVSPLISQRVQAILADAMDSGASDIHLESTGEGLRIKYRIDGVLVPSMQLEGITLAEQIISRLKILSELDIAERRIPQDGRFQTRIHHRDVDFRVSIMPSLWGEDAVIRILDRQSLTRDGNQLTLDAIGFDQTTLTALRKMIHAPYGMLLVTGPTGSGKTTTLYAALSEINKGEDKIITIEDPVEYQLTEILQIPVNERKGLTFARGLRSILRHDPDKIMVGEIRDEETADIAVQAALTGHLVFTTVHANNVFDVIGRFTHMGVDTHNFVSALTGVVAQRLVRLLCTHCSQPFSPGVDELALSGLSPEESGHFSFRQAKGCEHCRHTGYKGRRAIAEVLPLNDELRDLIINRSSLGSMRQSARKNGMRSLREAVIELVCHGETTLQEANRVTFAE
ncbi:MAG TPA: general secretion pathway protein GspE [Moraxellaceae bacterium]|nr:general secretion pathway protein GspE [Moraxellaceae bacterium]